MKIKKTLLIISFLFINLIAFSQQIGDGLAPIISDFTTPLKSGTYNGYNPTGAIPDYSSSWQHLFVVRHPNINNNYQLQLASSIEGNDRLFFRKIAWGDLVSQNPVWHEMATREGNTFNGNQTINGNLFTSGDIVINNSSTVGRLYLSGAQSSHKDYEMLNAIYGVSNTGFSIRNDTDGINILAFDGNNNATFYSTVTATNGTLIGGTLTSGYIPKATGVNSLGNSSIYDNGTNVGIGTTAPDEKLTVNGTIHATEVKVTQTVPSDYVFQKYYTGKSELKSDYIMPTLAEIESFTKKNHHLPDVPSAQNIKQNGLFLGEMSNKLLQKVEELTLYAIEQQKKLEEQNKTIEMQSKILEVLTTRLSNLEKKMILKASLLSNEHLRKLYTIDIFKI